MAQSSFKREREGKQLLISIDILICLGMQSYNLLFLIFCFAKSLSISTFFLKNSICMLESLNIYVVVYSIYTKRSAANLKKTLEMSKFGRHRSMKYFFSSS